MKTLINFLTQSSCLVILLMGSFLTLAETPKPETIYVRVEPFIITNFPKDNGKYGFINVEPALVVTSAKAVIVVNDHMPMVKDFFVFLLGSLDEKTLTDYTQRDSIRKRATEGLQAIFTKETGKPLIKDVLFSKYITQ